MSTDNLKKLGFKCIRFWTEYKPTMKIDPATNRSIQDFNEDGSPKMRSIDMVEYCAPGQGNRSTVVASVTQLSKVRPLAGNESNEAIVIANVRWDTIRPQYQAWKRNEEVPVDGTPLGAWSGLTASQATAFRNMGIRSVEEVAECSDSIIDRLPFSGGRVLRDAAQTWLKAADRAKVSGEIAAVSAENKELKDQLEEMRKILIDMQAQAADDAPKRRGRPPRDEAAAA